jgi:hypothetical protein
LSGGNYQGLFGVSISPFVLLDSGIPFNITTGQDLNGDNQLVVARGVDRQGVWEAASGPAA